MKNKTIVQFFLLTLLLLISFLTFSFYLKKNVDKNRSTRQLENLDKSRDTNNKGNLIENIKYNSNNTRGDTYELLADFGEASIENPDLMFLENVKANIILVNKEKIYLTSDFANFNSKTFETTFINNVRIIRENEIITGNELYLVLDEDVGGENNKKKDQNLLRMSYNILVQKPGSILKADVIEIDLITKNVKIYMHNKIKKVIAKTELK